MPDYSKQIRYHFDRIHFAALGGLYRGRGVLDWEPAKGFHIEAPVERIGVPLHGVFDIGKPKVLAPQDFRSIRIRLGKSDYAFSPRIHFGPSLELLGRSHLSLDINQLTFAQPDTADRDHNRWFGSATFACADTILLPGEYRRDTFAANELIGREYRRGAFTHKDDEHRIRCTHPDSQTLRLEWALNAQKWPFQYAWTFGRVAALTFSILTGQTVSLLQRTASRRKRQYQELRKRTEPQSLGLLAPFGPVSFLNPSDFVTLVHFLNQRTVAADVCEAMFDQLAEASRQQTRQGRELLVGTILESALRTIEATPFDSDKKWRVGPALQRFREKYWDQTWDGHTTRALSAFRTLRHRNAHPDWLAGSGTNRPAELISEAFDDLQFLVRFYGYMILALAGIKRAPRFPGPAKDWGAPLAVTIGLPDRDKVTAPRAPGSPAESIQEVVEPATRLTPPSDGLQTPEQPAASISELPSELTQKPLPDEPDSRPEAG